MRLRSAFTLLEILIVVACIGVLMSLTLVAVQAAREASRRTHCQSNLRQCLVGFANFQTAHHHYPLASGNFDLPTNPMIPSYHHEFSPFAMILPFVEQQNVYEILVNPPTLAPFHEAPPAVFQCPGQLGNLSYRACIGNTISSLRSDPRPYPIGNGVFTRRTGCRLSEITDGLSNTVACSERVFSLQPPYNQFDSNHWSFQFTTQDVFLDECQGDEVVLHSGDLPQFWHYGTLNNSLYNHIFPPNSGMRECGFSGFGYGIATARGLHSSGVNVGRCDGSTAFIAESVDLPIWRSLASRAEAL